MVVVLYYFFFVSNYEQLQENIADIATIMAAMSLYKLPKYNTTD